MKYEAAFAYNTFGPLAAFLSIRTSSTFRLLLADNKVSPVLTYRAFLSIELFPNGRRRVKHTRAKPIPCVSSQLCPSEASYLTSILHCDGDGHCQGKANQDINQDYALSRTWSLPYLMRSQGRLVTTLTFPSFCAFLHILSLNVNARSVL